MNPVQTSIANIQSLWESSPMMLYSEGTEVQTVMAWTPPNLFNTSWTIVPSDSGLCDERTFLPKPTLSDFLLKNKSNAIVFLSPNLENDKQTWFRIYHLVLYFLENGIKATNILGCNSSAFKTYQSKGGILYDLEEIQTLLQTPPPSSETVQLATTSSGLDK